MSLELKLAETVTQFIGIATLSFSIVFWEFFIGGILINSIYKFVNWQTTKHSLKYPGYVLIGICIISLLIFLGPKAYVAIAENIRCFLIGNIGLLLFWGLSEAADIGIFRNKHTDRWHWISLLTGAALILFAGFIFYETTSCASLADKSSDLKDLYNNAKHIFLGTGIMSLFTGGLLIGLCFEKAKDVFNRIF